MSKMVKNMNEGKDLFKTSEMLKIDLFAVSILGMGGVGKKCNILMLQQRLIRLEQESGFFFKMNYFEKKVVAGEWDEVEKYLSGFTKVDDNKYSIKIFFEIRKQKFLEALERQDKAKAIEILMKELKVFSTFSENVYKDMTQLLTLDDFREHQLLKTYGDIKAARSIMVVELKKLIEINPLFREKLISPPLSSSRLRTLINQSLNRQHHLCKNPRPYPKIKTLLTDHTCSSLDRAVVPVPIPVDLPTATVAKPPAYATPEVLGAAANASALAGWMANAAAAASSSSAQAAIATSSSQPVPGF